MINKTNKDSQSEIITQSGYFQPRITFTTYLAEEYCCRDCRNMTRLAMSCYAAAKHSIGNEGKVPPKEKPKTTKHANKYAEADTSIYLDKYNGKLMNSIWGLYNRNSPHNLKAPKQNIEGSGEANQGQEVITSSVVQFAIPQFFGGIVSVEATYRKPSKPKTSLEKFENLFNFPIV